MQAPKRYSAKSKNHVVADSLVVVVLLCSSQLSIYPLHSFVGLLLVYIESLAILHNRGITFSLPRLLLLPLAYQQVDQFPLCKNQKRIQKQSKRVWIIRRVRHQEIGNPKAPHGDQIQPSRHQERQFQLKPA